MDVNVKIKLELSEGLEEQVERLLALLTTATYRQEEDDGNNDENFNDD